MSGGLVKSVGLPQGVALYVAAVIGSGVLILPGVAASTAGPAAILAWAFDGLLGIPLALTFAALAVRFPDAGGVSTFVTRAFTPSLGAVVGWSYFVAVANGQIVIPLTGAYYVSEALSLDRTGTLIVAFLITLTAVGANLAGLWLSARLSVLLSAGVALLLLAASASALPRASAANWSPFAPAGLGAAGYVAVLIFFAFFGWEAIAHLSAEFRDPRDVRRATLASVGAVTMIYLGVAFAVIATHTYGDPQTDRVSAARLLGDSFGIGATSVAAVLALVIALGTANAFIAAGSRLGHALARDGSFPPFLARIDRRGVPGAAVLTLGTTSVLGMLGVHLRGAGAEDLVIVSSSLGLATYVIAMAAAVRLLRGASRLAALASGGLCAAVFLFAGASLLIPVFVGALALVTRALIGALRSR